MLKIEIEYYKSTVVELVSCQEGEYNSVPWWHEYLRHEVKECSPDEYFLLMIYLVPVFAPKVVYDEVMLHHTKIHVE